MAEIQGLSSATNPYEKSSFTAKANEKNTLTIESYFKLLSAQLAHQDMTNPMDNSEMMAQMTQMAMVQSLGTMTSNMKEEMALTKTTYLAGLIGKEVTVKLPNAENSLIEGSPKEKTGVIESVNMSGKEATFRMVGDSTDYSLESLLQIRQEVVLQPILPLPVRKLLREVQKERIREKQCTEKTEPRKT